MHTATPWHFRQHGGMRVIQGAPSPDNPENVQGLAWTVGLRDDVDEANAALIVRAVNAHDQLVAALEAARTFIADTISEGWPGREEALAQIDAALLKAKAMTDPLKRMAIASCESLCRRNNRCGASNVVGDFQSYCLARAKRCWDATLPLSDEQIAALDAAANEYAWGDKEAREIAEIEMRAIVKAAKGESQ